MRRGVKAMRDAKVGRASLQTPKVNLVKVNVYRSLFFRTDLFVGERGENVHHVRNVHPAQMSGDGCPKSMSGTDRYTPNRDLHTQRSPARAAQMREEL